MRKSNAKSKVHSNRPVPRQKVPFEMVGRTPKVSLFDSILDRVLRDLFRRRDRKSRRPSFALEVLEPRLLLSADPVFSLNSNTGALTGQLTDNDDNTSVALHHDVNTPDGIAQDGGLIIDVIVNGVSKQYGDATHGVTSIGLQGLSGNDVFTLVDALPIGVTIDGGADNDTIQGPALGTEWTIDGTNSGSAKGITSFTGIENLVGGAGGRDQFKLEPGGAISIDGGAGAALDVVIGPNTANTWTLSGANSGDLNGTTIFVGIESLTGGMAADNFIVAPGGSLSGLLDGGLVNADAPAVDSLDLSLRTSAVTVDLALAEVSGVIAQFSRITSIVGSNALGNDTLRGPGQPGDEVAWSITGDNAGEVGGTAFSGFENLTGRSSTSDAFFFNEFGTLGGTLDGGNGVGTADGLEVWVSPTLNTVFTPAGTDAAGTITIAGKTIDYAGLDGVSVLSGSAADRVIRGSVFADNIVLEDADPNSAGTMKVTFVGLNFFNGIGYDTSFTFANPTSSLTILGGLGGDHITVLSVDQNFAADLLLYGSKAGAPAPEPDAAHDVITFAGDTFTRGGYLEAFADDISVADGITVSTLADQSDLATGNDIVFRARRIGTTELENLLPSGYISKSVSITIGADAVLKSGSIYLVAQAEDRDIATQLGLTTLESQFFVAPGMSLLNDLTALPIKVLIKSSSSQVTIGDRAQVLADNVIGIYSTAAADASAAAASQLFSLGYSQAKASAIIDVHSGALIEGGGAVNLTSDASATAKMSTETSREEQGSVPGKKSAAFAASIAVSYADVVSKATVAEGATVHGGRTVNIRALGDIESEAEAESGLFADGSAAIALALQFSTADIQTTLAGHVKADMNTVGGEVVKFEFDPEVAASDYTASQSPARLKDGETVKLGTALGSALPAGTVFAYHGDELANPGNLGALIAANFASLTADQFAARWEAVSEPWGYVDTANDRISVFNRDNDAGNWVVVTEDTVDYSPRRGTSIGGLDPGTYVVVALPDNPDTAVDESHYIKLARTEQQAIDAYAWEAAGNTGVNPYVINLTPGAVDNHRSFDASNVNPDNDTITLPGVGNTFELGQAVIYREAGRTDADKVVDGPDGYKIWQSPNAAIDGTPYIPRIEGLEHGGLYYTMVGVDQFNLIGDQRLVDKQVVSLGALENETRGGIARIKIGAPVDPNETGFTLSAQHILDSTFLTFGGVSALSAADSASATAGFAKEDASDPKKSDDGGFKWGNSAFDNLFNLAIFKYTSNANAGGANGNASIQIGGALAFSFTDHKVQTLIKGSANLDSNDDMELTANITEELKLKAESTGEAQKGKTDPVTKQPAANTSADTSVSVAIIVGVENNDASAIIESGAHLDSMRALRLLSGVTYPFLTRPDEFVPTSAGELSDRITSEGLDFVNTYLDGTGGLSSLFNTWARSTTSADKVAIAGSINVLSFNNSAQSIVHTGAFINQDPFYRPDPRFYLQPGDVGYDPDYAPDAEGVHGNDNITHSANANNVDEHVVSVEATNYMQFMNVTGVFGFHLPSLELSDPLTFIRNGIDDVDMSFDASLTPVNGGRGGVGGAIFLQFLNNTTHAIVEHGVDLYSGGNSGLNIKAEEAIMGFAFSQAGADAGKVAVGGTFSYFEQNSDTLAQLSEGSRINGGRVDVYAGSLETEINWAGGVAKSKAIGAGIAVAINSTDRSTRAIIGEADDTAGTGSYGRIQLGTADDPADGFVGARPINGTVTARASVAGGVYSFAVAGAVVNTTPDVTSSTANGKTSSKTSQSNTGIGIAGAASDRKSTRLNSSHAITSRMPSSA